MSTHSPAEWAAFLSLGVSAWAVMAALLWLTVDAEPADFDPRPAARRAIESGRLDAVLIAVTNARHAAHAAAERARHIPRDTAITAAALLSLTIPTGDHR
ncbi:hypothetical protein ACIQSP_16705 [Streptomyces nigra]|uniref:hypothetical protein n=1 Tax=Streptomyces nigra TaxID=1827580 RepID=UPI00380ED5DF